MGKVTGKDIMRKYEERNSARSVQSSSANARKVTGADIMSAYEKKQKLSAEKTKSTQDYARSIINSEGQRVATDNRTLRQQNQDYATGKMRVLSLAQEKAIEDYNAQRQMYKALNGLNTADGLVGAGDIQALGHYNNAQRIKQNSGMSEKEFVSYADNWNQLKDLQKSQEYDRKSQEALKGLSSSQKEELDKYNASMQQYKNRNMQNASMGIGVSMEDYEKASAVKREFMSKYGVSSEDFDKYAQYEQEYQDRKSTSALQMDIQEDIKKNPVGAGVLYTGLDILTSPIAGLLAAGESLKSFGYADKDAPVNTDSYLYALQNMGQTATEQILEEINNPVGQFAYNAITSPAKTVATTMTLGPWAIASFGASAYSSALKNAQDKGISKERAMATAVASGAAEMIFEKVSLDHLYDVYKTVGKTGLRDTVLKILAQSGIEGIEEVSTELTNIITDNMINGEFSDYGMNIKNYQAQGLSAEDARKLANIDAAFQVGESFLLGMVSGGILGGGATAVSKINYHNLGKSINQDADTKSKVIEAAQAMDKSTTAKEIVANTKVEEITDEQMAQIIESMAEVDQKNETDVVSQILSIAPVQESNGPASNAPVSNPLERVDNTNSGINSVNGIDNNITERNHGVTKATLPGTNEQVIALKFEEVSKDTATVRLGNNTVVPLSEVQMNDRTMQQLYNFASTVHNTKASNVMLDRYAGQPMEVYARACITFYNAGQLKTASFDEMVHNSKNAQLVAGMGDTATLYQMFELGRNSVSNIAPVQPKVTKQKVTEGKVIDNRTDKSESRLLDLYTLVAKRTGVDIELNDALEHGARGNFTASLGKIALSNRSDNQYEVLVHELMEYASTYNPQKMQEVYDMVLSYAMSDMGAERLTQAIKAYQNAYEQVEHGKTFQSASEEFLNDYIAGVFSTEEGVRDLVDFMAKENVSAEQQRSILQTVADFFRDIANKISQYIEEHVMSDTAKMGLRADEQQVRQIRETVLSVLEDTIGSVSDIQDTKVKKSLNVDFASEVDAWYNDEEAFAKKGGFFMVGRTSEALKTIGVKEQDITWDKSKIKAILKDHPEMDINIIKAVPEVIENPIIVMQSKTRLNSITVLGEVQAKNEQPVMVAMHLQPEVKSGRIMNMIKISNSYARNNTQGLINTSDILYVEPNKNRTDNWLSAFGLQLPVGLTNYGPIDKVTYYDDTVNKTEKDNSVKTAFSEALEKAGVKTTETSTKKSLDVKLSLDVDLMSILEEEYSKEEQDSASIIEEGFASLQKVNVDKKTMHKLAYKLKKEYKSAYSIDDLTDNLTNVFAYLKDHPDAKYEDMLRIMREVARPVIEESTDVDTWEKAMYDNFREYFRGKTIRLNREQIAEVAHYYGSFENFRRQNFGSINFSAKNGTYLDSIWEELVQQPNFMLDIETYGADQPIALVDTLQALKPVKKNIYGMNTEQASYDLALDIFRQFFVEQAQEKANEKVAKKAVRLVERQQEFRKTVRKEFNEAVARLREYDTEKRDNMRREYQIKLNDAKKSMYAAVKDHDKEAADKYEKMEKFYQEQIRLLNQETNEKILAIKASNRQNMANRRAYEEQKRVRERIVRNAKGIINYFNTNTDKRHVPEALKTPIAQFITSIDFISEKANPNSAATLAWQDSLNLMYRRLTDKGQASENGYEDVYAALNGENGAGDVLKDMSAFLEQCSGKRVTDLSVRELEWLDGVITALKRAITDINRLYVNKRTQSVAELGRQSIQELLEKKDKKSHAVLVEKGMNVMDANMLDSRSFFDRLGEAAFSIYDELRTAFNERVWLLKEAQDYMTNALEGLDVKKWTGENAQVHDFVINGQHLQMTTAQIMSLYELNKRNQAKLHMTVGGIHPTVIGKGSKQIKRVTAVKLTSRDIDTVCNALTVEQKAVADKIQKFLADNCAKWGNKASMQMYGYERFGAKNYFPIRTDGNTVDTKDDSKFWFTKNQGFTKETVKNASNPLIVSDIFEVFTKHVTDMASYSTYSAAMMDAMKWYNFRSTDLQGDVVVYDDAVKTQIERVYGNTYLEYFKKLIEDINAENKRGIESEIAELLTSNMKTASVGANLRVAIQQPTAYLRAAAVMDPKYLSKAVFKKSAMQKAKEHSAITLWKSWGYFETSIGRSMQNVLTGQKTWKEKAVDTSMAMAQFMDDFTWGYLWNACEAEISDKHKEVKYDSSEYLELVSKRFDEVVDQTQVVDTVLHKSHIMRSKNLFNKMVTSFMSEPTKSYNLLMNRMRDVYEGKKGAKKMLSRAVNAYIVTQILNAAVVSIIDAFRDWDEDDKTFVEKYLENFKENAVDNTNPLTMIPYAKDLISIVEGYDVNRQDMQGMYTLINGSRKVMKYVTDEEYRGKHTLWEVCKELIKGGSQVYGTPAYNPIRDIEAIWNTLFPDMRIGGRIYSKTEDYNDLLDGLLENDQEAYDRAYQDLIDKGVESDDIPEKIISKMKERYEEGTLSKEDAIKLMIDELNYDGDDVWFKANREWDYGSKYGLLYNNIDYAYNTGNTTDRRAIDAEIKELLKHGVEESDIAAGITRKYKEDFVENPSANMKNLLLTCYMYCGYTRDEAMKKIEKWSE